MGHLLNHLDNIPRTSLRSLQCSINHTCIGSCLDHPSNQICSSRRSIHNPFCMICILGCQQSWHCNHQGSRVLRFCMRRWYCTMRIRRLDYHSSRSSSFLGRHLGHSPQDTQWRHRSHLASPRRGSQRIRSLGHILRQRIGLQHRTTDPRHPSSRCKRYPILSRRHRNLVEPSPSHP